MKILPRSKIPEALFHFLTKSKEDMMIVQVTYWGSQVFPTKYFQVSGFAEKPENSDPVLRYNRRARKGKN